MRPESPALKAANANYEALATKGAATKGGGEDENKRQESPSFMLEFAKNRARRASIQQQQRGGSGDPNEDPPPPIANLPDTPEWQKVLKESGVTGIAEVLAETFGGVAGDAVPELTDGTLEQALAEAKVLKSEREALLRSVNQKEAEVAALHNLHELASKGGDGTGGAPAVMSLLPIGPLLASISLRGAAIT